MLAPVFHGTVSEDGRMHLDAAEARMRENCLRRLAGKRVEVVVRLRRQKRSLDQNAWWWGVCLPVIADALGYDRHEHGALHYALVETCFGSTFDARIGRDVPNARSSELTTAQFSELMEWAVRWAATEHGIVVPLPNESEAA